MDDLTGLDNLHSADMQQPTVKRFSGSTSSKTPNSRRPISQNIDLAGDQLEIELKPERQIGLDASRQAEGFPDRFNQSPVRRWLKKVYSQVYRHHSIEILKVTHACQRDKNNFIDGWITHYKRGDQVLGANLELRGWLLGRCSQPVAIQFLIGQKIIAETPINIPRPDVIKVHFYQHLNCGFNIQINVIEWTRETEVLLNAVFPEGYTSVVGSILLYKYG